MTKEQNGAKVNQTGSAGTNLTQVAGNFTQTTNTRFTFWIPITVAATAIVALGSYLVAEGIESDIWPSNLPGQDTPSEVSP